jgi:hypothetical protein
MNNSLDDAPIEEIRELRQQISARFDNDPARLIEYYLKLQEQYRARLVNSPATEENKEQNAA